MARDPSRVREWRVAPPLSAIPQGLTHLPPVVAQVLHNRGIATARDLESFLDPPSHDPSLLPGIEPACQRIHQAIRAGEAIAIFGDFDVDGVTATALLAQALLDLGARVVPYIPDRVTEGHGLNREALQALSHESVSLLVTVDTGVTYYDEVAFAQELGMDVIVTDHHVPPDTLPPALAIVSPKVPGAEYPFQELSGAGLALKVVQGLYDLIGQPWNRNLLELVALSTVADLVPLRDENRLLVREGLKELQTTRRPGLVALYQRAGIRPESLDAETIAFSIAPRLNAAGRLDHAATSYRLLLARSQDDAEPIAATLEALNRERQRATTEAWAIAREAVEVRGDVPAMLLVADARFSPGIAGLVASRLAEEYNRPAAVMSVMDGTIRASLRSVPGFDLLGDGLYHCADLFQHFGGHRQAAGFTMAAGNLPRLEERLGRAADDALGKLDLSPVLNLDAQVSVKSLVGDTYRWLKDLEPYGVGNPAPVFLTRGMQVLNARPVGGNGQHLRMKLKEGGAVWDAIAFRQAEQWHEDAGVVDVVYTPGTQWKGTTQVINLKVLDLRPSGS